MTTFAEKLLAQDREKRLLAAHREKTAATPAEKPVERLSITQAAKAAGTSRDTIYRLYRAGFVKGWTPGPRKVYVDVADLHEFMALSANPGFWTEERKARYNRKEAA